MSFQARLLRNTSGGSPAGAVDCLELLLRLATSILGAGSALAAEQLSRVLFEMIDTLPPPLVAAAARQLLSTPPGIAPAAPAAAAVAPTDRLAQQLRGLGRLLTEECGVSSVEVFQLWLLEEDASDGLTSHW